MPGYKHGATRLAKSPVRPNRILLGVGLVLVVGICALFLVDLHARYQTAIEDTKRSALSFAEVLAEHTARTFEAIDLTLKAADSIRRSTEPPVSMTKDAARKGLQSLQSSSPALLAIGWTNAKGDVLVHSYPGAALRANISDLPHFTVLRDQNQEELFVSPLFRSKSDNGPWICSVARRLNDDNGNFAGVVSAPLDLSYFSRTYRSVQLGDNDVVALMRRDGSMLMREPYVDNAAGKSFVQSPLFRERLRLSESGTFEANSPVDKRDRIYAFRAVSGLPLIILVAQDRADALAGWYRHIKTFGPLVGLLVLVIAAGTILLYRKTGQQLKQTALLVATLENMHEGMIVVDNTNRIAIANSKALDMLDLPPGFIEARPTSEDVIAYQTSCGEFEHASPDVKARVQPKLTGDTAYLYERQRPNGTLLEVRTVPFADGGVVRTYRDITVQRRMENELSHSERQFRILAEHATDIIARLNFEGEVQYISPSGEYILGYTTAEMKGADIKGFIHPDDVASTVAAFELIAAAKRPDRKIEYRFRHKSGGWLWLEANPTLVFDEAGRPREWVDVIRDITERKRIEAEAAAAKAQAEQAATAKGEFLASMSHEIRTPLNSIIGFSDIILNRDDIVPDVRRQVGLIQTASDSLLSIVNDVLDFSRIEEGKLEIAPVTFDVAGLIDGSVAIVKGAADAKHLDLHVLIDRSVPSAVIGDDQRLRQVLLNLLNNAIKFTYKGFVQLDIACVTPEGGERQLRFSVSDTGVGIPPNKQDRLFQRFSQVDSSISREFGGSGLGLAICKRLVDLMAGEIGFESRAGAGSTFWFAIPLVLPDAAIATGAPGAAPARAAGDLRILLVEDLEVNREIATAILGNSGYQVDAVPDGADAIAAVKARSYDLVLMDVQMPGIDGVTATKIIRALPPPACDIPIIAMTANVLADQVDGFIRSGMNGHVGKPFKPAALIAAIEAHLGASNRQSVAEVAAARNEPAIDQLRTMISPEQLDALLAMLARRLEQFQSRHARTDHATLQEEAHRLASSAGLLGFRELSGTCAQLDIAITEGREIEKLFEAARRQSRGALLELNARAVGA